MSMICNHKQHPIILALDFPTAKQAFALINTLDPNCYGLKVGKSMFTRYGPLFVQRLVRLGFRVFLDLKFHDIPNTVADACSAAADLGVWMLNVHVLGGEKMLTAAAKAVQRYGSDKPLLLGVTILTSLSAAEINAVGITGSVSDNVIKLATLAKQSGCDGVVCSAHEAQVIRKQLGENFCLVTPGIRLPDDSANDQTRIMTPSEAIKAGSNYLVIGRPVTEAKDPLFVLENINEEMKKIA